MRRHHVCASNWAWCRRSEANQSQTTRNSQRRHRRGEQAAVLDNGVPRATSSENPEPSVPPTLEAWDLVAEPITERSRLYSLAPIGIGTAFVESLSGYAERLAEAHAVSAGNLIGRELFVRTAGANRINVGLVSYAVNGV